MATSQTATTKKTASRTPSTRAAKTPISKAKATKSPATKAPAAKIQATKTQAAKTQTATAMNSKKTLAKKTVALPAQKTNKPKVIQTPAVIKSTAGARLFLIMTPELRYKSIQAAAYLRAEKRGFASGHALEDWVAAEMEIDAMLKVV